MRQGFAHEAVLVVGPDGDTSAPGAAITVELCGHWNHEPPCPLAPHHVRARGTYVPGAAVAVRAECHLQRVAELVIALVPG